MFGSLLAGKIGYAASCVLAATALLVSGYAFHVEGQVSDVASSRVDAGGPQVGDMNILLMGLESRTYWNGQPLPKTLEDIMHVGSIGGDTTNTLILLHIYDNGKKAIGVSIPRDDVVTMYGTHGYGGTTAKVDEAYGDAMSYELQQLQQDGQAAKMSRDQLYFQANEAGRAAEIQTVQALTGVHIDHFAELNLWGFYELANIFGPIEVCLKQAAYDPDFSGANIPAGYHALSAAQALAFVRQRENLPNGDLDRTHRQQAVLDYVIWKVKHQNLVADLVEGNALLNDLKTFMITSGGWNIVEFATEMQNLTGRNLAFQTLPIQTQENNVMLNGRLQDINIVDPAYLKQYTHNLFYPAPAPKKTRPRRRRPPRPSRLPRPSPWTCTTAAARPAWPAGLPGAGLGRVQARRRRQRLRPAGAGQAGDPGLLRHRDGGQRGEDRQVLRGDRHRGHIRASRPCRDPARHGLRHGAHGDRLVRRRLWRYLGRCPVALGHVVRPGGERRAVGRLGHGQAQRPLRHPLCGLTRATLIR